MPPAFEGPDQPRRQRVRLIITADDFGRDAECTAAIAQNLAAGRITATSIMANASHFDDACALARAEGLTDKIGVHLVLDEGPPLSREMRRLMGEELRVERSLTPMHPRLARAVEAECAAQIDRVLKAGISPTHLDSHRHIHTVAPVGRIVVRLARRYGIPYVRPARNLAKGTRFLPRAYKWVFNAYVSRKVRTADYFGDIADMFEHRYELEPPSLVECMVHLDTSARGIANRQLLSDARFEGFLRDFTVVSHANAGY